MHTLQARAGIGRARLEFEQRAEVRQLRQLRVFLADGRRVLIAGYSAGSRDRLSNVLADHGIPGLEPRMRAPQPEFGRGRPGGDRFGGRNDRGGDRRSGPPSRGPRFENRDSAPRFDPRGGDAPRFERPPVCREHTPGHDPRACEVLTDDALAEAMQRVGERLQQEDEDTLDSRLTAAARDHLQQLCPQHRSGRFCVEVAEQQLIALEPALAVQALQVVCDAGRVSACERTAPLRELGADLRVVPLLQVPCGRYQADGGVIETLDFGDGTRARLQEGAVHLQQDGETLVLRQLGNGDLLGMDAQTAYQRYQPVPGTAQCTPPREGRGSP